MERDPLPNFATNASRSGGASIQHPALAFVASLRPDQWTKNLISFAGLIFGQRLLEPSLVATSIAAFVVFCGLSSAMYLINDVVDRAEDRRHPVKSRRPIAAGTVSPEAALRLAWPFGWGVLSAWSPSRSLVCSCSTASY